MSLHGAVVVEDDPAGDPGRPDALAEVANQPIANHVLDALRSSGVEEIVLVSSDARGDLAERLGEHCRSTGLRLRHINQRAPVDVSGALVTLAPVVGSEPCIVHSASGLLSEPLGAYTERLRSGHPDVTVFVHQGAASDGHLNAQTQEMLHLAELDPEHAALGLAGAWFFGRGALPLVAECDWRVGNEVDLTRVTERVHARGGQFQVVPVDAWRSYRGDCLDLLELNRIALDRLQTDLRRSFQNGNQIEGRVWIHEQATVRASVIVGPTVIGPGARVTDAYIGPYTSVGEGAHIEGAEIERSIISAGATIMHVGGRIVSSVVGRDARVARDFSLPRALRLRIGDGTEVTLC
jgi:glucose-1-phosphate thymidylyltransferase